MFLVLDQKFVSWIFFFSTLVASFFKMHNFGLPHFKLEVNMCLLVILQALNQVRLYIAIKSNKTEKSNAAVVAAFLVTSLLVLIGQGYFMVL